MTDKQKQKREEPGNPFNFSCCGEQSNMRRHQMRWDNCAGRMTRMMKMFGEVESEEPDTPDTFV